MPLPTDTSTVWPPAELAPITADLAIADAWWTGDPARLAQTYGRSSNTGRRGFWSRPQQANTQPTDRVHVPIAADIATASADLLFGEDMTAECEDPATQDRLDELLAAAQVQTVLLEGAEVCSAFGGVFLRPVWDPGYLTYPLLDVVHPDRAVPEWRWGRLAAVTFWRQVASDGQTVWRHLERHETGWIMHGLYAGSKERLGVRVPLDKLPVTADLPDEINVTALLGAEVMLADYVANVRPNRRHRGTPWGRPDTAGMEGLMDALDESASGLARDVRLGKARVIVPDQFLDRGGRGTGATFDPDREIFSPLDMDPGDASNAGITVVQPEIRAEAHMAAMTSQLRMIVSGAGYSPATFGLSDQAAVTATEVRSRDADTLRATSRKQRYWGPVLADQFRNLLLIDRAIFGGPADAERPTITFPPLASEDPHRLAETLATLRNAQAASIEARVRIAQPGLDDTEVAEEVERIKADEGIVTDPTGGFV